MRCAVGLVFVLLLVGCGSSPSSDTAAPGAIAFDDVNGSEATAPTIPEISNEMGFEVGGERFLLETTICSTYGDETFKFALAEGALDDGGRITATIERFDTGLDYEIILAIEGIRADDSTLSWYAQDPIPEHKISAVVLGGSIEGFAVFDDAGGDPPAGDRATGSFWVRCN